MIQFNKKKMGCLGVVGKVYQMSSLGVLLTFCRKSYPSFIGIVGLIVRSFYITIPILPK